MPKLHWAAELLVKLQTYHGDVDDLREFNNTVTWSSNSPFFGLVYPTTPLNLRAAANVRRQSYRRTIQRSNGADPPTFPESLLQFFESNDHIDKLWDICQEKGLVVRDEEDEEDEEDENKTMPQPPHTRATAHKATQKRKDDDVDESINGGDDVVGDLSSALKKVNIRGIMRNPEDGAAGFRKQAATSMIYKNNGCLQLGVGSNCKANPWSIEVHLFEQKGRLTDDGRMSRPYLHFKYDLPSALDYPHVNLELDYETDKRITGRSNDGVGTCVLKFTCPSASLGKAHMHNEYIAGVSFNDGQANKGNLKYKDTFENRLTTQEDSYVKATGPDLSNPNTVPVRFVAPVNEATGLPWICDNNDWQGETFADKPANKTHLKKNYTDVPYDHVSSCGTVTDKGRYMTVYWDIPLQGAGQKKFVAAGVSPMKNNQEARDAAIKARCAGM
jgi:hypothetical protein